MFRPCPSCGAEDVRRDGAGHLACNVCGERFTVDEAAPESPKPRTQPPREAPAADHDAEPSRIPKGQRTRIVAWLLPIAALSLVALWIGWGPLTPGEARRDEPEIPVSEQLRGIVVGTTRGQTDDGTAFWLFSYRNDGVLPIRSPTVELRLFDAQDRQLGRHRVTAPAPDVLAPGQEIPMRLVVPDIDMDASPRLQVVPPSLAQEPAILQPLGVRHVERVGDDGPIRGTLSTLGDDPMRIEHVVVVGRRRDGRVVQWADVDVSRRILPPGTPRPFEASVGEFVTLDAVVWTAHAWGRPL